MLVQQSNRLISNSLSQVIGLSFEMLMEGEVLNLISNRLPNRAVVVVVVVVHFRTN